MSNRPKVTKPPPRIDVYILAYESMVMTDIVKHLLSWVTQPDGFRIADIRFIQCIRPVTAARNLAVQSFLEGDAEIMLFWDHDIMPMRHNDLSRLVKHDKPVISACCFMQTLIENAAIQIQPASMRYDNGSKTAHRVYWGRGLEEVDVCTGGFFLVKREVLNAVDPPYFDWVYGNGARPTQSEEFYFAKKIKDAGFSLWTDYSVIMDHWRPVRLLSVLARQDLERQIREGKPTDEAVADVVQKFGIR